MNRTQRAIKKACKQALKGKKREKRIAVMELREYSLYEREKKKKEVTRLAREEKGLREWHRKMLDDYTCRKNSIKEDAVA